MNDDCLLSFYDLNSFLVFYNSLDIYNGWKINYDKMNSRGKKIEHKRYTKMLRETFQNKNFFRRNVSLAEVVSWIDNMSIMYRIITNLKQEVPAEIFDKISIKMEYRIQFSKNMRIDVILEYSKRIIVVEFRTTNDFTKLKTVWDYKFRELLIYKELMSYYLPNYSIYLYAFISMYEYQNNKLLIKQQTYNNNQVAYFLKYIKTYLLQYQKITE